MKQPLLLNPAPPDVERIHRLGESINLKPLDSFFKGIDKLIPLLRSAADAFALFSQSFVCFDSYAAAGYPLGKSWKGRKRWVKRQEKRP